MKDLLNVGTSGNSLILIIPKDVRSRFGIRHKQQIMFDMDMVNGVMKVYFAGPIKDIAQIEIPPFLDKKLASDVILYLKSEGPKRIFALSFLMISKSAQMKFQAIKDYYFRKGNMYMNELQCLCWVDNPSQKPKDIVYKKISPEESKRIADENAAFEAKLTPKVDLSEIDASLDAEVVEVVKEKRVEL